MGRQVFQHVPHEKAAMSQDEKQPLTPSGPPRRHETPPEGNDHSHPLIKEEPENSDALKEKG